MGVGEGKRLTRKDFERLTDVLAFVVLDIERFGIRQVLMPIRRVRLLAVKGRWNSQGVPGTHHVGLCLQWPPGNIKGESFAVGFFKSEFHYTAFRGNDFQINEQFVEQHEVGALIMQPRLIFVRDVRSNSRFDFLRGLGTDSYNSRANSFPQRLRGTYDRQ